ncbi:hypothetical protein KC19_12G055600 [Ceratodon purpureus]|uniref:Uncharacterized protein n=1 Tax=Ceratodon purpureus TaxID=3225 RepID=A0A8T0G3Z3_CERPU|nr:hypothetical protein KC19_12G055600 [Ceratodon purpureus]
MATETPKVTPPSTNPYLFLRIQVNTINSEDLQGTFPPDIDTHNLCHIKPEDTVAEPRHATQTTLSAPNNTPRSRFSIRNPAPSHVELREILFESRALRPNLVHNHMTANVLYTLALASCRQAAPASSPTYFGTCLVRKNFKQLG